MLLVQIEGAPELLGYTALVLLVQTEELKIDVRVMKLVLFLGMREEDRCEGFCLESFDLLLG